MTTPNEEQWQAITWFQTDLLVSAGAGTGKTGVLTRKFLRLLEERRAEVGEIVAITFTNKAATEMRQRVQREIKEKLTAAVAPEETEFWKDQDHKLEKARIATFHGFCLGLIQEYPLEAGVPPVSRILTEGETALYLREAAENALVEVANQSPEDEKAVLSKILLELGWEPLVDNCCAVYQQFRENGRSIGEIFNRSGVLFQKIFAASVPDAATIRSAIEELLSFSDTRKLTDHAREVLADFKENWPSFQESIGNSDAIAEVIPAVNQIRKGLPKNLPKEIKEHVLEIHDLLENFSRRILDREAFSRLPFLRTLFEKLDRGYCFLKLEAGLLDFADLQLIARDLLLNKKHLADNLRRGIKYLLVDEFQDTNQLQMEIIQLLLGDDNLAAGGRWMAVGDLKQSIYGFRGAEADILVKLRRQFETRQKKIVTLNKNYRSTASLIDYLNLIAEKIFETEEFAYEPLTAVENENDSEIEFILTGDFDLRNQAEMVADRIYQMVAESRNTANPILYKDIVILFRAGTAMPLFQQALQEKKIPFYSSGGAGFFNRREIRDQLNLLRLVEQQYDAPALLGLLSSPYLGLSRESLFWLAETDGLIERFYRSDFFPEKIPPAEQERLIRLRRMITLLHQNREQLTIAEIIRTATRELNYREMLRTYGNSGQRLANLEKLLTKAEQFTARGFTDLTAFLNYIQELEGVDYSEGDAPIQAESNDVVRLMTIHRAKGLEFPIVILPDLDRRFQYASLQKLVYHKEVGIGFKIAVADEEPGATTPWEKIKRRAKQEQLAELKRVLYVALTRARNRLILAGSGASASRAATLDTADCWMRWFELLHSFPEVGSTMDFHGLTLRVTRETPKREHQSKQPRLIDHYCATLQNTKKSGTVPEPEMAVSAGLDKFPDRASIFKISGLLTFMECPRRYYLQYRLKLPESHFSDIDGEDITGDSPGGWGVKIGNFWHQAVRFHSRQWPEELWRQFINEPGTPSDELVKLRCVLEQMWLNFIASEFFRESGACWDETSFIIKLNSDSVGSSARLEGRFDRLFEDSKGNLVLVDYKTHRIAAEKVDAIAQKYFPQLQLYAIAVQNIWGRLPDRAEIFFPFSNRKIKTPLDRATLQATLDEAGRITSFIINHDLPEDYSGRDDCRGCGYRNLCREI